MDEAKLKEIKSAEDQARSIIDNAKKEFSKIISQATEDGLTLFDKEKTAIKSEHNKIIEKFKSEGESDASKTLSELSKSLAGIDSQFSKNKSKAVEYLLGQIKVHYGNR
jgi:vacuolar-type H+-ATPase subunit H